MSENIDLTFNFLCARTWLRTARMTEASTRSQRQLLQLNFPQPNLPDLRFSLNPMTSARLLISQIPSSFSLLVMYLQFCIAQEISELVSSCLSSPLRREKLATAIENDNYIKKLLNIFTVCEVCVFCPVLPLSVGEIISKKCVCWMLET